MTPAQKRAAAALVGDAAALIILEFAISRLRQRARAAGEPGPALKHPWLMAVAAEVAAELGDAIVYQRHRAAAAIDRAVATQHLQANAPAAAPAPRSPMRLPIPRSVTEQLLPPARGSSPA